jgi:hypothetical protein
MTWPFTDDAVEATRPHEVRTGGLYGAPGLRTALSRLRTDRINSILDLGPAVACNLSFMARFPCHLRIVDLLGCVAEPAPAEATDDRGRRVFSDRLLPLGERPYDLVLAWDVLDHLDRGTAARLASRLRSLTRPGARLYALAATSHQVGSDCTVFAIRDLETLEYRRSAHRADRSPPFSPAELAQLLSGFAIERSVILRHGFQEYVAVRDD